MVRSNGKRFIAAIAIAAILAVGCGGGGGSSGVPVKAYAAGVCKGLHDWQNAVKKRVSDLSSSLSPTDTIEQRKAAIGDYLDNLVSDTQDLVQASKDAGVPDVSAGEETAKALTAAFGEAKSALQDARDKVDSLPTTDSTAFQQATDELGNSVTDALNKIASKVDTLTTGELDTAINDDPNCQSLET